MFLLLTFKAHVIFHLRLILSGHYFFLFFSFFFDKAVKENVHFLTVWWKGNGEDSPHSAPSEGNA